MFIYLFVCYVVSLFVCLFVCLFHCFLACSFVCVCFSSPSDSCGCVDDMVCSYFRLLSTPSRSTTRLFHRRRSATISDDRQQRHVEISSAISTSILSSSCGSSSLGRPSNQKESEGSTFASQASTDEVSQRRSEKNTDGPGYLSDDESFLISGESGESMNERSEGKEGDDELSELDVEGSASEEGSLARKGLQSLAYRNPSIVDLSSSPLPPSRGKEAKVHFSRRARDTVFFSIPPTETLSSGEEPVRQRRASVSAWSGLQLEISPDAVGAPVVDGK